MALSPASIFAHLPTTQGCAVVRDGDRTVIGVAPDAVVAARHDTAFAALDVAARGGFWTGYLAYDLGRAVERIAERSVDDLELPDVVLARYDARLVLTPEGDAEVVGDGPTAELLARAAWRAQRDTTRAWNPRVHRWDSSLDREQYEAAVGRVLEHLVAGDCYQVNLTRRLRTSGAADPIELFGALARTNPAPHAMLCTFGTAGPDVAIVSASPELFLRVDGRDVTTRPIKGTDRDPVRLAASAKDRAENIMIVDLGRNDLGRVCRYGSITVPELCAVEAHPGLYHLVSTVCGVLRDDVTLSDLVRATFPPASITGAPKPRVMEIIEELEPVRRGVYCGAVGWIDGDAGRAELAVAIRTFVIAHGQTFLGVGGGIVADSSADREWAETELKAARLLDAASGADAGAGRR
jgi:para-aminobenzoate synthetase component 1